MKLKVSRLSTVWYKGTTYRFEAKSTENPGRFGFKENRTATIDYTGESREDGKRFCFFAIELARTKSIFVVPLSVIQSYVGVSTERQEVYTGGDLDNLWVT